MAIDFPASPSFGQTFVVGTVTYTWDGVKWTAVAAGGGGGGSGDKIEEGNTSAEVIDTGSDGRFVVTTEGSEALRVDPSGKLLVGTSSSLSLDGFGSNLQVEATTFAASQSIVRHGGPAAIRLGRSGGSSIGSTTLVASGNELGALRFIGADGSDFDSIAAQITCEVDGTPGADVMPGRLMLSTTASGASTPTERFRIAANGSSTFFNSSSSTLVFGSALSAGTSDNFMIGISSRSTNTSGGDTQFVVRTNGNVQNSNNSYGSLSDIKLKENIVDASSQWDDLKALQVRKYNFKKGQTHTQIGLVAQEAELVSPGLVSESPDRDEDGNDLGTVTKSVNYSVLYMKAVKALQEAMERIETLEAKVTALEAK